MTDPIHVPDQTAERPSPGSLIRRTRERAGLSLEDLAAQMKLSKNTLDALERDDFNTLKEAVYVRGYYRKCAKVLPVSEPELLAAYEARVKPKAPPTPSRIVLAGGVAAGDRKGTLPAGAMAAVAIGLLAGFLIWNADRKFRVTPPPAAVTPAAVQSSVTVEAVSAPVVQEPPAVTVADPAALQTAAPATEPTAAATSPEVPAPARESPAPPAAALTPAAPGQLVLTLAEQSWVRVEDSRTRTLVIGLVRAGERRVVDGEPPYMVYLQNALQARVEFGGQPMDVSRHILENGTARFTVP